MDETVSYYDFKTKRLIRIPASELAPGAAQARIEGIDEIVWVDPSQITLSPVRHPPFSEPIMAFIRTIEETFREFHPISIAEWEEGFRRDGDPNPEIALWLHSADIYKMFTKDEASKVRRLEVFQIIVGCLNSSPEGIWHVLPPLTMTREETANIVDCYFGKEKP